MAAYADVEFEEEDNRGHMQECVFVECQESGDRVGPVWGHSGRSVRRALAILSEECSCGERYHKAEDPDDEED